MHASSVGSRSFRTEQTFLHTFHRRRLQIYYRHSNAFSYGIKKHTSCAIHTHSGKSYNPVSCERAQVAGADWSGLLSNPLLWRPDWHVRRKKEKRKRSILRNICVAATVDLWHNSGPAEPLRRVRFRFIYFFGRKKLFYPFVCFFKTWYPRDDDVREDRVLRTPFKCWNLYSSRSRLWIAC